MPLSKPFFRGRVWILTTFDGSILQLNFTVNDPGAQNVSLNVLFGSEEFPIYVNSFVDIAGVFIDGVNYALFDVSDPTTPLSVLGKNVEAGYFLNSSFEGTDQFGIPHSPLEIEYNGMSRPLTITGALDPNLDTHSIIIAIADTGDDALDSGIFISDLKVSDGEVGINLLPNAVDDSAATQNGVVLAGIAVLANDIDPDGDPLSITELGGVAAVVGTPIDLASGAQVTLNADGTVAYNQDDAFPALAAGVEAVDSFTYAISDGQGGTDTATVQVTVTGVEAEEDDCDCGDSVLGTEGADNMRGTTADDSICGLGGDDTITGSMGNDKLIGGSGDDHLNGGIGNDTLKGGIGEDSLNGGIGDDMLNGGEDNDDLQGGNGVDTLLGGDGDDTMNGGNDADVLQGGTGNDVLNGGTGEDRLEGGEGDDTLTGGVGADTFVFKPGFGNDTITSFQIAGPGHDFLEFDSGIFADTAALFAHSADTADGVLVTTDAADTLLIKNASLAQLQAHPEDFHFV